MKKKVVPVVPIENGEGDGNIEHPPHSINALYKYDFVINNYRDEELCQLYSKIIEIAKKAVVGKEVGESGTPHLQCYISLKKKMRMTELTKIITGASFRPCRNEEALIEYCKKGNDIWCHGFPKPVKIITELYNWQKDVETLCMTEPDDRTINWFYGVTGCNGKSSLTKYMIVKHKALLCQDGRASDIKNLIFNADMDNCKIIIFDLTRSVGNKISFNALESIKDGLICNTKYETGTKIFNPPHVVVFANERPDENKISKDRWNIVNLEEY